MKCTVPHSLAAILIAVAAVVIMSREADAQPAVVTSWIQNLHGETGYKGLPSNVQKVQYSDGSVYVSCSCIPGYDIGPWPGNPNTPANQNFVFRITRTPQPNTGAKTATPLGHVALWSNGVSMFNAKDARSYNNAGVWNQNAIVVEGSSFDECLGHPAPNGEYHHHLNPVCLYDSKDATKHSPIIGYSFDGYPVYGAYGFANADGSGGPKRMRSSYRLRSITDRTTLPDGSHAASAGPAISTQYPLGYYIEDFEYVAGLGDLDEHNGRVTVTPEYPEGTYAYFVTIDEQGTAAYPYTIGPTYYGVVPAGNTGPQSGHVTVAESVQTYVSPTGKVADGDESKSFELFPNPATDIVMIEQGSEASTMQLRDVLGKLVRQIIAPPSTVVSLSISDLPPGSYLLSRQSSSGRVSTKRLVKW